jgi:hypothetical protein
MCILIIGFVLIKKVTQFVELSGFLTAKSLWDFLARDELLADL